MMVPLRVISTHTDITDRKKAEEELNQSEQKYRGVFPCSPSGNCHLQCQVLLYRSLYRSDLNGLVIK